MEFVWDSSIAHFLMSTFGHFGDWSSGWVTQQSMSWVRR